MKWIILFELAACVTLTAQSDDSLGEPQMMRDSMNLPVGMSVWAGNVIRGATQGHIDLEFASGPLRLSQSTRMLEDQRKGIQSVGSYAPLGSSRPVAESVEHWFARQQYEQATQLYEQQLNMRNQILNEVTRLQSKWYTGLTLDRQEALLTEARRLSNELDAAKVLIELLKFRLEHADDCAKVYIDTIDRKNADLTVRETELVKACQSVNLYPPSVR